MDLKKSLTCPKCSGKDFIVKREVTYLYTYKINSDNIQETDYNIASAPFLFDNREKENSNEYIECEKCGTKYPISFGSSKIDLTIMQKAVVSDYTDNPEYLG